MATHQSSYGDQGDDVSARSNDDAVRELNALLRGEISAAETYRQAIDRVSDSKNQALARDVGLLQEMQEDHVRAADLLRDRVKDLGGEPSDTSGAWGAWAQTVQGAANLFGDTSALKSLKEGEEHGLKDYEDAMRDVDPITADVIRAQCIPTQRRHIDLLDQLIAAAGRS